MSIKTITGCLMLVGVALLSACAKQSSVPVVSAGIPPMPVQASSNKFALGPHQGLLGIRQYYFTCDSTLMPQKYQAAAKAQAAYLNAHPTARIQLQGFSSSRGSHEYNLALSQRRVKSVADVLRLNGASIHQISLLSYGAEMNPVDASLPQAKNCRVDLVYLS